MRWEKLMRDSSSNVGRVQAVGLAVNGSGKVTVARQRRRRQSTATVLAAASAAALLAAAPAARAINQYWDGDAFGPANGGTGIWDSLNPHWASTPGGTDYTFWDN